MLIGSYSSWFMRASNFAISVAYEFNLLKTNAVATRIKFNEKDLMIMIRGDSRFNRFALCLRVGLLKNLYIIEDRLFRESAGAPR